MKNEFKVLTDREHVLARPGVYIGSTEPEEISGIIDGKYQTKTISGGLIKIIEEIYQNSIDEAIRTDFKHANKIDISVEEIPLEGGVRITIKDNGRGIPVVKHEGGWQPVLAWTQLRAGSNFEDKGRITAGLNGMGAALTNIFSRSFKGYSSDGKGTLLLHSQFNMASSVLHTSEHKTSTGVTVTFEPDLERFNTEFTQDHMDILRDRLMNLSILYEKIKFTFNGEKLAYKNLKTAATVFGQSFITAENEFTKMVIAPSGDDSEFRCLSYVNGIYVRDGGSHIDYAMNKIIAPLREVIKKKHKIDVVPNQIRQHLLMATWINGFENLKFDSQTKERITNVQSDSSKVYEGIDFDKIARQILNTPEIIDPMIEAILHKKELADAAALRKAAKNSEKNNLRKIAKFTDANVDDRDYCMLFITEGLSAASSVLSAREPNMACYPLRGKPINAVASTLKELLANAEFVDLMNIIGLKLDEPAISVDLYEVDIDGEKFIAAKGDEITLKNGDRIVV